MGICIKDYQDACGFIIDKLKKNDHVIGIIVYGSMVSGDIWDESDIDFLVITDEKNKKENIYSKVSNVKIHVNYMSRDIFMDSYKNNVKIFNKMFFADKLIFCRDKSLENMHLTTKFYENKDLNMRSIGILCKLLSSLHYTKKYMNNGKIETAYQWTIEVLNNCARLVMNLTGHIVSKDVLSLAVNMNSDIEDLFNIVTGVDFKLDEKINRVVSYADNLISTNLENISKPIVEYLKAVKVPCSVTDIKNSSEFKNIDGKFNLLMEKLSSAGIVKEGMREYTSYGDEYLIDEIVYFC